MNSATMSNAKQTTSSLPSTLKAIMLFVVFMFCGVTFAQDQVRSSNQELTSTSTVSTASESVHFISWFMGTKQSVQPNSVQDLKGSSKKQLINSGSAPNRLLLKTFSKKAANFNSAIV
jgi:hypothetical protein